MTSYQRLGPVIIIGMHRSGTSLLTKVLERAGLFIGSRRDRHDEALFFLSLNRWLLREAGGRWDRPEAIDDLLNDPETRHLCVRYLNDSVRSPRTMSYLGITNYLKYRGIHSFSRPWGWKDPRTTFTLPLWLEVFPEARVIHLVRHGADVAKSLLVRRYKSLQFSKERYTKLSWIYRLIGKRSGFSDSVVCRTPYVALDLWDKYVERAEKAVVGLGKNAMTLRYEDLVMNPQDHLAAVFDFCGLVDASGLLREMSYDFDSTRAFAFREDPKMMEFSEQAKDVLAKHGY